MSESNKKNLQKELDYPSVVVFWLDSCEPMDNSEVEKHEIPEPQNIIQCGFLIKETEEYISVAGAVKKTPEEVFDYVISIPKLAVTKIVKI